MINQTNRYQPIVTSGKSLNNNSTKKVLIVLVILSAFMTATWLLFFEASTNESIDAVESPVAVTLVETDYSTELPQALVNAVPRTVYRLYHDPNTKQVYLFKATFLTKNQRPDVDAITIKKEGDMFVAYDVSTGKKIPNLKNIVSSPLDTEAAIVYSDNSYLLLKNKNDMGYQLEMIDPFSGELKWTISELELNGLDKLNTIYSADDNLGVQLFENDFSVIIPPNKFIISKEGRLIDFYKIN